MQITHKDFYRFLDKIDFVHVPGGGGCWNWTAGVDRWGYGKFKLDGKYHGAHRVAFAIYKGEIPDGMFVLHSCDNRRCCSPGHLSLGSHKQNMDDMTSRGRQAKGEGIGGAVLDVPKAANAKRLFMSHSDHGIVRAAAKALGIDRRTVRDIRDGKLWKHVDPADPGSHSYLCFEATALEALGKSKSAVFTDEQVSLVRCFLRKHRRPGIIPAAAKVLGVGKETLRCIREGLTYRHVAGVDHPHLPILEAAVLGDMLYSGV
jgi:hypothetical protein